MSRQPCYCCSTGGCQTGCGCYVDPPGICKNCGHYEGYHLEAGCIGGGKLGCSCNGYEEP